MFTLGRTVAASALVFIGAALLILSGLVPDAVRGDVFLLLPITWLAACCGLAVMALERAGGR